MTVTNGMTVLFILLMPLVNVLGPATWLAPPVVAAIALFIWLAANRQLYLDDGYAIFIALALWCFLQLPLSAEFISRKTIMHCVSVIMSITLFYATVRCGLLSLLWSGRLELILRTVFVSMVVTSTFILFEFAGSNYFKIDVSKVVPYIEVADFEASAFGIFLRPRGFASEPGSMALFYDVALFFVAPLLSRPKYLIWYMAIILPGYLLLLSAGSFVSVGVVVLFWWLSRLWNRFSSSALKLAILAIPLLILLVIAGKQVSDIASDVIGGRVSGLLSDDKSNTSASDRATVYQEVSSVLSEYPTGIGFGITPGLPDVGGKYRDLPLSLGQISLLGMFMTAGGFPAAILLIFGILISVRRALRVPFYGAGIAAGGVAVSIHHLFVTEFWLPFFWFFLASSSAFHRVYSRQDQQTIPQPQSPIVSAAENGDMQ